MKVIRHGKKYQEMSCPYCDCYFSFTLNDITINEDVGEYEEYLHTCYNESIFCPECTKKNFKNAKKIVLKNIVDGKEC